jgi:hypothetical protein
LIIIDNIKYFFKIINWHLNSSKFTARHKFLEAEPTIEILIKSSKSLPVISKLLFYPLMNLLNNNLNRFFIFTWYSFLFFIGWNLGAVTVDSRDYRRHKFFI